MIVADHKTAGLGTIAMGAVILLGVVLVLSSLSGSASCGKSTAHWRTVPDDGTSHLRLSHHALGLQQSRPQLRRVALEDTDRTPRIEFKAVWFTPRDSGSPRWRGPSIRWGFVGAGCARDCRKWWRYGSSQAGASELTSCKQDQSKGGRETEPGYPARHIPFQRRAHASDMRSPPLRPEERTGIAANCRLDR